MIAVVGSVNWDIAARVDHLPRPGETVKGSSLASSLGGKGANQAVAAARAGGRVRLIARVGSDGFGASARKVLEREGLDLSRLEPTQSATGVALIGVDETGQNSIIIAPGANQGLLPEAIDRAALDGVRVLLAQLEVPLGTVQAALQVARTAGVRTVLNASPTLDALGPEFLKNVDVLLVNEVETAQLLGRPEPQTLDDALECARALQTHVTSVVLTLGARGAVWREVNGTGHEAGRRVRAVDTTGAGDAFAGALTVALEEGASLAQAVAFANAAGALAATRPGAATSAPTRTEIETMLESQGVTQ